MNKQKKEIVRDIQKRAKKGNLYESHKSFNQLSNKNKYIIACSNWEFHIMEQILMINDIPVENYLYANKYATVVEEFRVDKKFKNMSKLDWDMIPSETCSLDFRGKFCTLLLLWIMNNSDNICKKIQKTVNGSKGRIRRKVLKNIIIRVDMFVVNFLSRDTLYSDNIEQMLDLTTLWADEEKFAKLMENFINQKAFILSAIDNPEEYDFGLVWDSIMKLAYMVTTNTTNFKNIPKYKTMEELKNFDIMKEYIGRLGLAILIHRKNSKRKKPILYSIYTKACPLYYSWFDEIDDAVELNVGVKALSYLAFLIDDEKFTNILTAMI